MYASIELPKILINQLHNLHHFTVLKGKCPAQSPWVNFPVNSDACRLAWNVISWDRVRSASAISVFFWSILNLPPDSAVHCLGDITQGTCWSCCMWWGNNNMKCQLWSGFLHTWGYPLKSPEQHAAVVVCQSSHLEEAPDWRSSSYDKIYLCLSILVDNLFITRHSILVEVHLTCEQNYFRNLRWRT